MNPEQTRNRLLAQHERLRELIGHALVLADRFLVGRSVDDQFSLKLAELRVAFTAHNELEQGLLAPLLQATGDWGPARLARMLEEHAGEHAAFVAFFDR